MLYALSHTDMALHIFMYFTFILFLNCSIIY